MLKSTAVAATVTGLAGCMGILGGGCGKPSGDLEAAMPSGGEFEQQGDPSPSSEGENVESSLAASYKGPDGESFFFGVTEFTDAKTAKEEVKKVEGSDSGEFGWIRVDQYVYFAFGPEKDSVKALLAEAKPLNEGCVNGNVEWA